MVPNSINFMKLDFHQLNDGHLYQRESISLNTLCNMLLEEEDPINLIPTTPTCPRLCPCSPSTTSWSMMAPAAT